MQTIATITNKYKKEIDFLDLEMILANSLGKTREFVLAHPEHIIPKFKIKNLKLKIIRRIKHEPLAYILGHKEFYGLDFSVNKNTLVPRPETEQIVDLAISESGTKNQKSKVTIIDIGTGSGNIIVSLAKNSDNKNKFFAIDISAKALLVAKQNAKRHRVDKKIKFLKGNLLEPFFKTHNKKIGDAKLIITANLPYLDNDWKNLLKSSETKGLKFEPSIALYSGSDGLDHYRKLAKYIETKKIRNSILFCEIGHIQKRGMRKIFSFAKKVEFFKDLAGKWRICKISL